MDEKTLAVVEKTLTDLLSKGLEGVQANLSETLDAKIAKFFEDNKITSKGFPVAEGEATDEGKKYANIGAFIKSVLKGDVQALAKGMTEGTDSAGGYLVPEEFNAEVMRIAADYGLVAKFAQKFSMGTDTLNVPISSGSVSVYWPGEAANGTAVTPTFGNAQLLAKDLVGITISSNQLLADSKVDVIKFLMGIFAEAFAGEIDNQGFNGNGTPFTGIFNDAGVTTVTMASGQDTFAETKLTDLRDLISNVPTSCLPTSAFFMHPLTWGLIQKIQENSQTIAAIQNQLINVGVGQSEVGMLRAHGMLWGYPVYLSDKIVSTTAVSTKFIAFGSMQKGLFLGDRAQTTMDISKEATISGVNLFQSNQSAVRLTQRVALKVALPTAFAVLKTAAS